MELLFADPSLQHTLESRVRVDDHFGISDGPSVRRRISELLAADSLAVAELVPTLDLRSLDSLIGSFSVQLTSRLRLRFEVASEPIPRLRGDGKIDHSQVAAIRIVGIEET
jgi:hypothetical protein